MRKSIKVNIICNIIKTIAAIIFPLITFPYVSRILLPDNVGKVNFAMSFINYFSLIAALGIATYAMRECALVKNDREKLDNLASQLFSINLITTIFSYICLAVALIFFRQLDSYRNLIIIYSCTILLATIGADWINIAKEDFVYITVRTLLFQIVSLALLFILVKSQEDYHKYIIICAISSGGANIVNFFYRKKFCKIRFTLAIDWKKHLPKIAILFVSSLSVTIMNNIDITMLGVMHSNEAVGLYSTAHKVLHIIAQIVQATVVVLIPRLSKLFENKDYDAIGVMLRKLLSINIGLGLPMITGIILLSSDIIYAIGGPEYAGAAPVLQILMAGYFFTLVGGAFLGNAIMIPAKKEKYYMFVICLTAIINVVLNALLIPKFGALGAGIATAINCPLVFIMLLFKVDKNIKIKKIVSVFIAPIIGCIIIVVICLLCRKIELLWLRVALSMIISVVVYGITLLLFRYDLLIDSLKSIYNKLFKKEVRRND